MCLVGELPVNNPSGPLKMHQFPPPPATESQIQRNIQPKVATFLARARAGLATDGVPPSVSPKARSAREWGAQTSLKVALVSQVRAMPRTWNGGSSQLPSAERV